jgi:GNAT superfamily N-acetyltransferase
VPDIRRLRRDEHDRALTMVVAAFRADPQVRWYFPDDASYEEGARTFFGVLLDLRLDGGEVWVADDCAAVAMWNPPGGNLIGPDVAGQRYAQALAGLPSPGSERASAVDHAVDRLLPSEAHWYLGVLACHPHRRGQGLASAVVEPVLASADRARLPVALETSTKANVAYYTRRGFAVAGETAVADGLTVYVMRREPLQP